MIFAITIATISNVLTPSLAVYYYSITPIYYMFISASFTLHTQTKKGERIVSVHPLYKLVMHAVRL